MNIAIASDHAGVDMKAELVNFIQGMGHQVRDFGPDTTDSVDYPDFAHPLAKAVEKGEFDLGFALCGSGNGINMTVNKHQGIRSALCWTVEISKLAREHNNANICAMPARFISLDTAKEITEVFLNTDFEGGRHERRVGKIACGD
ncbi:MAG TPA: ribose 5-phosphate isomerase B [Bacteroidales bacterium]|nr:ribose 5-phosphate isomerase B [Bacteroidales bacterium]